MERAGFAGEGGAARDGALRVGAVGGQTVCAAPVGVLVAEVSRLQSGALNLLSLCATALEEVLPTALESLPPDGPVIDIQHLDAVPAVPAVPAVLAVLAVLADPPLLERVVANLLSNAARHTPPGETVLLTASTLADRVEVRVIDRGPGMPAEDRERAFVPFQRLGDTDNTTGVGLGLALSRGLTEAMAGTLTPADTPGDGLTMALSLPAADLREPTGSSTGSAPEA